MGEGDLGAQARHALRNLIAAVRSVSGTVDNIAKMTWYVVNYSQELRPLDEATQCSGAHRAWRYP